MKKQPQYLIIEQNIIDQIKDGLLLPGDRLPTEAMLCEQYGVSRMTVNKALSSLAMKKYITRTQGKGSFVNMPETIIMKDIGGHRKTSFSSDAASIGKTAGAILVDYRIIRATDIQRVSGLLALEREEMVHEINRIRTIDGVRVALSTTWIPVRLMPSLDVRVLEHSLYRYLEEEYGYIPRAVEYTFNAVLPTKKQLELLNTGSCALLKSSHISIIENGSRFEYTETYYVGDRYTYHFSAD